MELGLPVNMRRRLDDLLRPLQPFPLSTRQQRCCSGLLLDPMQYMRKVASPGEPLDLIDLKFLPAWVKEDWSAARHAGFEGEEEQAHWSPDGMGRLLAHRVTGVATSRIAVALIKGNEMSASRSMARTGNVSAIFRRRDAKRRRPLCCRSSTFIFFRK